MARGKFWMCYAIEGRVPSHKHYSEREARTEAERIAQETQGDVFLLEATEFVSPIEPRPPVVWSQTTLYPR